MPIMCEGPVDSCRCLRAGADPTAPGDGPVKIGLVVVGSEILSGKRSDRHLGALVRILGQRGLQLSWARILADDLDELQAAYKESLASDHLVFSTGGIGITPDDLTRQAAAAALGVPLERHPEAVEALRQVARQHGRQLEPRHYGFVEFPRGASLIPNPVLGAPGFSVRHHHFLIGFAEMAWPMMAWVLDQHYKHLFADGVRTESVLVSDCYEIDMVEMMEDLVRVHPQVRLFSLPSGTSGAPLTEVGFNGPFELVGAALADLKQRLGERGVQWRPSDMDGTSPG